jgi:hypothetical protein
MNFSVGIGKKFNNVFSTDLYYLFVKDRSFPKNNQRRRYQPQIQS